MRASFETRNVQYEINNWGYERNGHFTMAQVELKELKLGQPAEFEVTMGENKRIIRTDDVMNIEACPPQFKKEMSKDFQAFKLKIYKDNKKPFIVTKIGFEEEVLKWAADYFGVSSKQVAVMPIEGGLAQ
ncbi:hypothetical protein GLW08_20355 [Pontibacillus yanchengensis]|uniref:Uncharacterized protein n=2 Tax=Pontibacillus yanchengensis TaxID=462910 RepID=A0ACC7VL00_9BACI|nr:hypothetical protein [Pontibacillus yanchengensis]MYL35458.1 hypothetical protein [Pontibacillus yanchengensis]MYL55658.1 hypothetical protein [Pontibacillus yanchengensis]